jgi:DNA-binding GntR family transcriptional regulator
MGECGLNQPIPNRGTFVAELSAHDIQEIYQLSGIYIVCLSLLNNL